MRAFVHGVLTMAAITIALFFLQYWRISRDRLFLFFTAAFVTMAVNSLLLGVSDASGEERYPVYLVRLLAFVIIIVGIVDKNRRSGPRRR